MHPLPFLLLLLLSPSLTLAQSNVVSFSDDDVDACDADNVSFEMVTGYVYTAPADMLDSQPGTLMLTDCIDTCRANSTCRSINYETGLCVLFSSNADQNDGEFIIIFSSFNFYFLANFHIFLECVA